MGNNHYYELSNAVYQVCNPADDPMHIKNTGKTTFPCFTDVFLRVHLLNLTFRAIIYGSSQIGRLADYIPTIRTWTANCLFT